MSRGLVRSPRHLVVSAPVEHAATEAFDRASPAARRQSALGGHEFVRLKLDRRRVCRPASPRPPAPRGRPRAVLPPRAAHRAATIACVLAQRHRILAERRQVGAFDVAFSPPRVLASSASTGRGPRPRNIAASGCAPIPWRHVGAAARAPDASTLPGRGEHERRGAVRRGRRVSAADRRPPSHCPARGEHERRIRSDRVVARTLARRRAALGQSASSFIAHCARHAVALCAVEGRLLMSARTLLLPSLPRRPPRAGAAEISVDKAARRSLPNHVSSQMSVCLACVAG